LGTKEENDGLKFSRDYERFRQKNLIVSFSGITEDLGKKSAYINLYASFYSQEKNKKNRSSAESKTLSLTTF